MSLYPAQFNSGGTLQQRYLFGRAVDDVLARTSSGGTTAWYLHDKLSSVRNLVDTSGSFLDTIVYDSFGNVLTESNSSNGDQFKFDGMQFDSSTALYFDNARYYNPTTGTFIRQDPKSFAAGDANLYRFVSNSPTNFTDPSGLAKDLPDVPLNDKGKVDLSEKDLLDLLKIPKDRWANDCTKALQILDNLLKSLERRWVELNPASVEFGTHYYWYMLQFYVYHQLYPMITGACGKQGPSGPLPVPQPVPSGTPPLARPIYVPGARPGDKPLQTNLPADIPAPPGVSNPAPPSALWWFDVGAENDNTVDGCIIVIPLAIPVIVYLGVAAAAAVGAEKTAEVVVTVAVGAGL